MSGEALRIVLARRPEGPPRPDDFRLEKGPLPSPGPDEVLCRTIWLSLDPYVRGRMSDAPSYTAPIGLGEPIHGEAVAEVSESCHAGFRPGDLVAGKVGDATACRMGWRSHFCFPGDWLRKLDPAAAPPRTALGLLGMPGLTAWAALRRIARPEPGETFLVAAAAGPVGALAGQLAKKAGCRVVGIAGGAEKCAWVEEALGFDACLDRHAPDLPARLAAACPKGIDSHLALVGGPVLDAALPLLNDLARVAVVGTLGEGAPSPADRLFFVRRILVRRLLVQGFIVYDHSPLAADFLAELTPLVRGEKIRWREEVRDGLESAPAALLDLLQGRTFGKLLLRVGPEPAA